MHPEQNIPLIIRPDALAELLKTTAQLCVIDVRVRELYNSSHIPGAIPASLDPFNRQIPPTKGLLPDPIDFEHAMQDLGLKENQHVVVYDDSGGPAASRFAWTLQAFNHLQVSILDGGFKAWQAGAYSVEQQQNTIEISDYENQGLNETIIADKEYILQKIKDPNDPGLVIVDARSQAEFAGLDVRAERGGHIPGAINLNWQDTKSSMQDTFFKSGEELEQLFQSHGIDRGKEIICYCQSHQRSAVLCLLLSSLGYQRVKGYPGAWSDWGNSKDMPVEN